MENALTFASVVEDVHSVLGEVPWETNSEEVGRQEISWAALSGATFARE